MDQSLNPPCGLPKIITFANYNVGATYMTCVSLSIIGPTGIGGELFYGNKCALVWAQQIRESK